MSESLPPTYGVFISKEPEKGFSSPAYEAPIPVTTLARIEKANLKPVHNLEEIGLLRDRSFGLLGGFAVISKETVFGVHIDYIHDQRGNSSDPIFTLKIIPPNVLKKMDGVSKTARDHIIRCVNDAKALTNPKIIEGYVVEPLEKVA